MVDWTSTELRADILRFSSDLSLPIEPKRNKTQWQGVLTGLDQLKSVTPVSAPKVTPLQ
jgi:hypothetical protein